MQERADLKAKVKKALEDSLTIPLDSLAAVSKQPRETAKWIKENKKVLDSISE